MAGGVIYYLFSPSSIFVRFIDGLIGSSFHLKLESGSIVLLVRCYLPDALWAYSCTIILLFAMSPRRYLIAITVILSFIVFMELIQIIPGVPGTFDLLDILWETVASVIAIIVYLVKRKGEGL